MCAASVFLSRCIPEPHAKLPRLETFAQLSLLQVLTRWKTRAERITDFRWPGFDERAFH